MKLFMFFLVCIFLISTATADVQFNESTGWANTSYINTREQQATGYNILEWTPSDAVSHWTFDEGSGTTAHDENETNNNDGTLEGNAAWNSTIKRYGTYSVYFDGTDDDVLISSAESLNLTDTFTISVWIYPTATKSAFVYQKTGIGTYGKWSIYQDFGTYAFHYNENAGSISFGACSINTWSYLSITYNKSEGKMRSYKNGTLLNTVDYSTSIDTYDSSLLIGQYSSWDFNGYIDEFRIYNYSLSNPEINQTRDNEHVTSGNVTHWHNMNIGYQGSQFKFLFNNDTSSFLEGWVSADNSTWYQVTDNMTNDTLTNIPAAYKNQTQYIKAILKGNGTSSPELIESVITTEASTADTAPNITSYAPTTPNSTYENVASTYNATINQSDSNNEWLINGTIKEWDNATDSPEYTNSTWLNGNYNLTLISHNASDHLLTDSQTWIITVLFNSVDINVTYSDRTNLSYNIIWNVTNITPGTQHWNVSWSATDAGNTYYFRYWNDTYIGINQTATSLNETLWFNSSTLLPEGVYYLSETEALSADTKFEYWTGSTWVEDEAQYYLWFTCFWWTAECANAEQADSQASLKIINNGTASGAPKMKLNESAPAGIRIFVDDDNSFAGAVELSNTYQEVSTSLSQDENVTLWAWANLSGADNWEFETYATEE